MGLSSTTIHIYKKNPEDVLDAVCCLLKKQYRLNSFEKIPFTNQNFEKTIEGINSKPGACYLITERNGNWTTIVELNVQLDKPFYLYDITNGLSKILNTYALMLHLLDSDVSLYNLELNGNSLDGYNSDPSYFSITATNDILRERHQPEVFSDILPAGKSIENLNLILNDGFWAAFDNNDLDNNGIPNSDNYYTFTEEEERLNDFGKYLEIYNKDVFPFVEWYVGIQTLDLSKCYLLKANKSSFLQTLGKHIGVR